MLFLPPLFIFFFHVGTGTLKLMVIPLEITVSDDHGLINMRAQVVGGTPGIAFPAMIVMD